MLDGDQDVLEAPNIAIAAVNFGVAAVLLFTFLEAARGHVQRRRQWHRQRHVQRE